MKLHFINTTMINNKIFEQIVNDIEYFDGFNYDIDKDSIEVLEEIQNIIFKQLINCKIYNNDEIKELAEIFDIMRYDVYSLNNPLQHLFVNDYLTDKLFEIYMYSKDNEMYETMANIENFYEELKKLKKNKI